MIAAALAALALVFHTPLLTALGSALVENDGLRKADAAVVLGGDMYATRIIRAAQLEQAGYVPVALVSGPGVYGAYESNFTIPVAESRGYPASFFKALTSSSHSTRTEAQFIAAYLRSHNIHSILLVTSNFHTRRAARLMRRADPGLVVYADPADDPFFTPSTWWKTREGQKTFLLEWTKTFASWLGI